MYQMLNRSWIILLLLTQTGCAWMPQQLDGFRRAIGLQPVQTQVRLKAPPAWLAPLPHAGKLSNLSTWWAQFNDPLLVRLISAAEAVSPSLASAKSRIAQARAKQVSANAALLPDVNATASASKGLESLFFPAASIGSIGLATHWELDIFGGNQAGEAAAQARLAGATAAWHDARVLVAAEVASQYNTLRSCEASAAFAKTDADSRTETLKLTEELAKAGFQAPANAALAHASAAQAANTLNAQLTRCTLAIKGLVALTGIEESRLRRQLQAARGRLAQPTALTVKTVPGEVLAQRPDIFVAAYEVLAASADISQLQAARYPKISFSGKISAMHMEIASTPQGGTVWSVGPLAVTLPLFDGGLRSANVDAARASYEAASIKYAGTLRQAVREVEEALITIDSLAQRNRDAEAAVAGFTTSFIAKESLYKAGLADLFTLEDARRTAVQAQNLLLAIQQERIAAWIALYRATGGDWADVKALDTQLDRAVVL